MAIRPKKLASQSNKTPDRPSRPLGSRNVAGDYFEWLKNRETGISPLTVYGYMQDLSMFQEWFRISTGEVFWPTAVTPVDVRNYKSHLQTVRNFKPATINRRLAAVRAFFDWAIAERLVTETPVKVHNVEELPTAPRSIDERTYAKLLRVAQKVGDKRTIAIVQLLRHSGLRVGELCSLRLSDLTISDRKGKVIVRSGKGSRYREVPLNLDARRALQDYLAERPDVESVHVFVGQRQSGLTDSAVQRLIAELGRLAAIDDLTPHVLRHTFGKGLIDAGVDLVTVKTLMGTSDLIQRLTTPSPVSATCKRPLTSWRRKKHSGSPPSKAEIDRTRGIRLLGLLQLRLRLIM
jgi:site-specific recombinase XerD